MEGESIDVWYGDRQEVGRAGRSQRWANVLGRLLDVGGLLELTATLDGGEPRTLSVGPDGRRLVAKGDFNVDVDLDRLRAGDHDIIIRASYEDGRVAERRVTLVVHDEPALRPPATIDWSEAGLGHPLVHVVDGRWDAAGGYVCTREIGYDRLIAIGDMSWRDYEVRVPVVVHGLEARAYSRPSVHTGVGVVMRWKGHSNWGSDRHASGQPRFGPGPYGAIGWWTTWSNGEEHLNFFDTDFRALHPHPMRLELHVPYIFRVQVASSGGPTMYRLKVWPESEAEPSRWHVEAPGPSNGLTEGSILLGAHETAASFGRVEIYPVRE